MAASLPFAGHEDLQLSWMTMRHKHYVVEVSSVALHEEFLAFSEPPRR
jgi:hypothetical protein